MIPALEARGTLVIIAAMRTRRLYCANLARGELVLSAEEAHHAASVLRLSVGDQVELFDGAGRCAEATLTAVRRKNVMALAETPRLAENYDAPWRMTVAVALPKTQRQGVLIEKCTELGVAAIQPLLAHRSVAKPEGAAAVYKWQRRAIEAVKQCGRHWVPAIESPRSIEEVINDHSREDALWMAEAHPATTPWLSQRLAGLPTGSRVTVLIGPEGGWSDEEKELALSRQLPGVRLAPHVLRTETAAIAASAQMYFP
ncbi:MAG: RsmE family RNA methyltransferase [Planctomycetota bacterium]|jgi:16S rRNA (uracil1498-N3)-methyltransferase